jgi:8-oxo-dGTP pyrophosphatase MutT (NUDIX family)
LTAPPAAGIGSSMPFPVVRLARAELRFAPRPWAFAQARRAEIDAHFAGLSRANPHAFNGRVLMLHEFAVDDGVLRGAYFETDFASFIAWRDWGWPDLAVRNCFAQAALRAADGAFLLGVMSAHTLNAGRIYFPSGTPDPTDIVGDKVDLAGSVMRELTEETGLIAADVTLDHGWHAVLAGPRLAMLKTMRSPLEASELRAQILAHLATEAHPELADVRIARGPADLDHMMPEFIKDYLLEMWKE